MRQTDLPNTHLEFIEIDETKLQPLKLNLSSRSAYSPLRARIMKYFFCSIDKRKMSFDFGLSQISQKWLNLHTYILEEACGVSFKNMIVFSRGLV